MLRNSKRFTELAPGLAAVSCATVAENDGLDPIQEAGVEHACAFRNWRAAARDHRRRRRDHLLGRTPTERCTPPPRSSLPGASVVVDAERRQPPEVGRRRQQRKSCPTRAPPRTRARRPPCRLCMRWPIFSTFGLVARLRSPRRIALAMSGSLERRFSRMRRSLSCGLHPQLAFHHAASRPGVRDMLRNIPRWSPRIAFRTAVVLHIRSRSVACSARLHALPSSCASLSRSC